MHFSSDHIARPQRATAIAVTLAVHVALLGVLYFSKHVAERVPDGRSMVFWFVQEKTPAPLEAARPSQTMAPATRMQTSAPAPAPAPAPIIGETPETAEAPVPESTPAAPSAADILKQARSDAGGIDRALRKQIPKGLIRAPVITAHKRFVKGLELANEMAPTAWYEAPKIREIIDPGGNGTKRYRVISGKSTYCLSYHDNRNRAGLDPIGNGIAKPLVPTNCDPDELPPTTQE